MVLIEHVVSLSNASLDVYPDNSLTKFTHRFVQPIKVPPGLRPFVSLRELVLSNHPAADAPKVGFIRVHLEEIDPVAGPDQGDRRVLATLANRTGRLNWIRPNYPVLCPLSVTDQIDKFSFLITDEWNRQLQLKPGPTTVVNLTVVMTDSHQSFTMTVGPDSSSQFFADNSLTHFSVELPETLSLDENWEVALLSAQAGSAVVLDNSRLKFVVHKGQPGSFAVHPDDVVLSIPAKKHNLTEAFIVKTYLTPWLTELGYTITLNSTNGEIIVTRTETSMVDNVISAIEGRARSIAGVDLGDVEDMLEDISPPVSAEVYSLQMNPEACRALGLTSTAPEGLSVPLPSQKGKTVSLRGRDPNFLPFFSMVTHRPQVIEHLAIYCDLADHSIMGNELAPIMDVVPTKKLHLHDTHEEAFFGVKHPVFRPVNPHVRKTFEVDLRSLDGTEPPLLFDQHAFEKTKHAIALTFVFRRKNQK